MESWFSEKRYLFSKEDEDDKENRDPYKEIIQNVLEELSRSFTEDDEINNYFSELYLLKGVPLTCMVPDDSMLPEESLRIFYIDPNWVACFLDGALSLGRNSKDDCDHDRVVMENIAEECYTRSVNLRNECFSTAREKEEPEIIRTGFLLRSKLVSGWPGLEVRCFRENKELTLLRLERLTDSIMLCLVDGKMDVIEFTQPQQSLYFSFNEENGSMKQSLVSLAGVDAGQSTGTSIPVVFRDTTRRVVNIAAFINNIKEELKKENKLGEFFSSVEFAAQMIRKRYRVRIRIQWEA